MAKAATVLSKRVSYFVYGTDNMKFVNHKPTIEIDEIGSEPVHFSSKMEPFLDNEHSFLGYTRILQKPATLLPDYNERPRLLLRKDWWRY